MSHPAVSVIVVSRHRPDALALCLTALGQLLYPLYEIVVVADPAAIAGLGTWADRAKLVAFDEPNISAARNLGISHAAGEILAFIDDDAVAEPAWLSHLTAPFADPAIMATGGYVRGRNGISFQWRGQMVDHLAQITPLPADKTPVVVTQSRGRALKTEGTNMAFRRSALTALGGFDPSLPFYLDETDVNLRLAATGAKAALVPLAQVHHGFAPSLRRHANRVPRSLYDVGASLAVFLRKHAQISDMDQRLAAEKAARAGALAAHRRAGRVTHRAVAELMASLDAGWADGLSRPLAPRVPMPDHQNDFKSLERNQKHTRYHVISGSIWRKRALMAQARRAVAEGHVVSLFLFSRTALFHHIRYQKEGYWLQTGGIFGKSQRDDPLFRIWSQKERLARELSFVTDSRMFSEQAFYPDN